MRLLEKLQINLSKAIERKTEVDQGKKLAASVDALRELKAKEEASLTLFRDQTIAAIKKDIEHWVIRRDSIKSEADAEEARRRHALEPLNEKAGRIAREQDELDEREERITHRELDIGHMQVVTRGVKDQVEAHLTTAITREKEAERMQLQANSLLKAAEKRVQDAEAIYVSSTKDANRLAIESASREVDQESRNRSLDVMYAHMQQKEKELSIRERAIIDREETFYRELKRQSK